MLFSWAPKSLQMLSVTMTLRLLLLGKSAVADLSILKSRVTSLMTEACIVKAVTFPVDMYGCELDYEEG